MKAKNQGRNLCASNFPFPTLAVGALHGAMLTTLVIRLFILKSQGGIPSTRLFHHLCPCLPSTHRCLGAAPGAVHSPDDAAVCGVRRWGCAVGGGWHGEWGREGLGGTESIHVSSHWHVGAHHRN